MTPFRWVSLLLGALGTVSIMAGALIWWRVVSSPGDDNFVGIVGLLAILAGALPSYGGFLFARNAPPAQHRAWLFLASLSSAVLILLAPVLLVLLGILS